jgi:hypothetical protein
MNGRTLACLWLALAFSAVPALAADDPGIARMAMCRDSWLDWNKRSPALLQKFAGHFRSDFSAVSNEAYLTPKTAKSIAGLRVLQVFPQSVGMGVGFSVTVDAGFEKTRKLMEAALGKPLTKCEASDGMHSCALDIAEQRTFTLMAADQGDNRTLVGCFYLYEK